MRAIFSRPSRTHVERNTVTGLLKNPAIKCRNDASSEKKDIHGFSATILTPSIADDHHVLIVQSARLRRPPLNQNRSEDTGDGKITERMEVPPKQMLASWG